MKRRFYNLLLIITVIIMFGGIFEFTNAQTSTPPQTLINYPVVSGQSVGFGMPLPQLIKYIYLFAVGICGAIALAAILLGAIKYIGAAGNSSKMADAKEQIVSAILGVVILLSSYLILYTINPDLVKIGLTLPIIETDKLDDFSRVDTYKCVCRCKFLYRIDSWVKDQPVTKHPTPTLWGPNECKRIRFGEGWEQCKRSCESTVNYGSLLGAQNASICTEAGFVAGALSSFITYTGSGLTSVGCIEICTSNNDCGAGGYCGMDGTCYTF